MANTNNPSQSTTPSPSRKKGGGFQVSSEPVVAGKAGEDAHKFELAPGGTPEPAYEDLGPLPASYGHNELFLIARDPRWLFTYWDIDWSYFPVSRMQGGTRKVFVKIFDASGNEQSTVEVNPEARNWYIPVNSAGVEYVAEIGFIDESGQWQSVIRSAPATTPPDAVSEDAHAQFATVPFHITFQRLLEMVRTSMSEGDTLLQALARLQGEGSQLAFKRGQVPFLTEEQKGILATLVGEEALSNISMGSGEIDQLLRKALLEKLQSESASELVGKGRLAELLSTDQSSLSSAVGAWGPEVSSLFSAIGLSQSQVTSLFSAIQAWGPESSSSLSSAFAGWGPGGSSLSSAAGAGAWAPEVSSLFSAMGLWGPESSSLFSGVGSSWSAQPFGQQRGFYLHVNAEVIFYGGTDPAATVWIDGKQIALSADGTFRYHFKFPDGNYEIPIVAKSPDGLEERSATLTVARGTSLVGEVGQTGQPQHLNSPLGSKS